MTVVMSASGIEGVILEVPEVFRCCLVSREVEW